MEIISKDLHTYFFFEKKKKFCIDERKSTSSAYSGKSGYVEFLLKEQTHRFFVRKTDRPIFR